MSERRILKNILSLSFAEFASKGIAFFLNAYLTRTLGVAGYGELAYVNSILAYLLMVISMGMYVIGIREGAKDKSSIQQYVSNITSIKLILFGISFLAVIVYVSCADIGFIIKTSLLVGTIQLFAHAILVDWVFISQEQTHIFAMRQVLINFMNFAGLLMFVHSKADIPIYILVVSVSTMLNNIWLVKMGATRFFNVKLAFDKSLIKNILRQAIPLSLSYFIITFMAQFGITYLTATCGSYTTGLFSASTKIAAFAVIPCFILQSSFAPRLSKHIELTERQNIAKKYTTSVLSCGAIISTTLFFFPEFFVYISSGESFMDATGTLKIISIYVMLFFISSSAVSFFFYWGMEKRLLTGYAVSSVVYTLAVVILVNIYGGQGAAYAMLCGDGVLAAIFIILLRQAIHKVYIGVAVPLLLVAILSCVFGKFINTFWQNNIYFHAFGIIIAVILFVIMVLKFKILDKEDIKKLFKR